MNWLAITLTIGATFAGAVGALFFKLGAKELKLNIKSLLKAYKLMIAVKMYGLGSILFIYALSLKDTQLSILYPIISLSYIWVALLSNKYLKEKLNKHKWIGMALIIAGVIAIGI